MDAMIRAGCVALAFLAIDLLPIDMAAAQSAIPGCASENAAAFTRILHCEGGVTIVAEYGAQFTVQNRNGRAEAVELNSKALLLDVPKRAGRNEFRVITPQAIAAVRGTKWAVDAAEEKTSVFVVGGRVGVRRRSGPGGVTLGPGEGVDVEAAGPLTVKRWAPARVSDLMERLGQ